jgi:hypothetical protein
MESFLDPCETSRYFQPEGWPDTRRCGVSASRREVLPAMQRYRNAEPGIFVVATVESSYRPESGIRLDPVPAPGIDERVDAVCRERDVTRLDGGVVHLPYLPAHAGRTGVSAIAFAQCFCTRVEPPLFQPGAKGEAIAKNVERVSRPVRASGWRRRTGLETRSTDGGDSDGTSNRLPGKRGIPVARLAPGVGELGPGDHWSAQTTLHIRPSPRLSPGECLNPFWRLSSRRLS